MHGLHITMVVPHGDGVNCIGLAQIDLHPLRAFLELHRVVVERLLFLVGDLLQLALERRHAAGDRLVLGHVHHALRHLRGRGRLVRGRLDVRAGRQILRGAFEGVLGQAEFQRLGGLRVLAARRPGQANGARERHGQEKSQQMFFHKVRFIPKESRKQSVSGVDETCAFLVSLERRDHGVGRCLVLDDDYWS